jgi:hypothetical protein
LLGIRIGGIERRIRPLLDRESARKLRHVAECDLCRAECARGECDQLSDRPASSNENRSSTKLPAR